MSNTGKDKKSKSKIIESLHHVPSLRKTLQRMRDEGKISQEKQNHIEFHLEEWVSDSKYILVNLGVHIGLGFVRFTAFPIPILPIGSTLRALWVMGNRMYCNIRWDMHKKRIHSLTVLLFSIIPFLGYFAYTIPLRRKSEYLTYLYGQHLSYSLYDVTLEAKLKKAPASLKKIAYALLVPKELQNRG